jgi:hypothetical protein
MNKRFVCSSLEASSKVSGCSDRAEGRANALRDLGESPQQTVSAAPRFKQGISFTWSVLCKYCVTHEMCTLHVPVTLFL